MVQRVKLLPWIRLEISILEINIFEKDVFLCRKDYTKQLKYTIMWVIVVKSGERWVISMFMGEYRHNLDAKGRVTIPNKFRNLLGSQVVVTRGLDGCITVYTIDQWKDELEKLRRLPNTLKEARRYIHVVTSKAATCEFDGQGRILIPVALLEEANIEKECVVIGVVDHVEIWAKTKWDDYYDLASDNFEDLAENLTEHIK